MSVHSITTLFVSAVCFTFLSGCGNKGELFLVSDQVTADELNTLRQDLSSQDVPTASPTEVEDGAVYIDLEAYPELQTDSESVENKSSS